jgi:sirohydrochlorin cobaltochelatase
VQPTGDEACVLLGHGARDPEWARPFDRLRARLVARRPGLRVELAYLELMPPTFAQAVETLARAGVRRVRVLPVFIAQGGHGRADVDRLVDEARQRWPQLEFERLVAVGEVDAVLDAIADYALRAGGSARNS